jgi:hypothetical protein
VAGSDDGEVASVAYAGDDDVIDPRIRRIRRLPRQNPDRRASGFLRTASRGRHHLVPAAADQHGAALRDQPPDLLGTSFVRRTATDDGDLDASDGTMIGRWPSETHAAEH